MEGSGREQDPRHRSGGEAARWDELTDAERSVVALVCEGLPNKEIAKRLFVAPATVHWHLKNVFRKLEVANRTELAMKATGKLGPPKPPSDSPEDI